jgi:hypothetical protein
VFLRISRRDPLIHIYANLTGASSVEVNAFQRLSDVVVQKSIRGEHFVLPRLLAEELELLSTLG